MLDKFQQKFVEEANDNVAAIEEALFELEKAPADKEIVERLFRSMHTIKGSGAMFGFNDLSHFTHNLETLYDLVRNDKVLVNKDIISLTFESLDYIRQLLDLGEGTLSDPGDIQRQKDYIAKITKYFPEGTTLTLSSAQKAALAAQQAAAAAEKKGPKNYLVTFAPFESLLNNGTNPLFMLDDLTALGKYKTIAFTGGIPNLSDFKPLDLYVKWQTILNTDQDINDIKDVFIFVEDECKMDIAELPDGDIIGNSDKLPDIIKKAVESQTELKADDFASFKEAPKPAEVKPATTNPANTDAPKAAANAAAKGQENKISNIKVSSEKIDDLVNAVSELVTMQAQLSLLAGKSENNALISIAEQMEKITRQLRENSFSISLIPLGGELIRFQRLVRDLCNKLNKQMEFVVEGGEIELDKNIIDHLTDPLLHIIRNSGDHGIESPEDRVKAGKNPTGTILLKAFYSGSSVIVQVSDDGKGMDPDKIFKKAVEKGLVDAQARLSKKEILNLIFASGFSTAEKVSDVSGRGVGMDVVKSKIAEIRGEVTVDSETGKGTTITMELPLTLSIIDGLLTKINGEQYVFPLSNVERILQPSEVDFNQNGLGNFFTFNGEQVLYLDLCNIFYNSTADVNNSKILIVEQGGKRVGMIVDAVIGEYQIVVKPLGSFLRSVDMISGASVMGDGSLSLVVDPGRLINFYNMLRLKRKAQ